MSLLEQASLVITPNAYKESKLYSVVPNTTLGDMDVVRATTATRVNSNGLIEEVPYNLVRYSEDISNSAWAKYNITMSANSTTAPNGTLTAEKLLSSNSTSFQGIEIQVNYISGQKYTNSIYFKYIDTPFVQIITPSFVSSNYVNFNIQTGEVVGGVYEDATVTSVGNGWYRCSFTFISNYTGSGGTIGSANLINSASSSRASDFTGNGVKGIYLWGAQLVTSTSAKEYFPTTDRLNIPRIDYTNGSCPSLLVEPQRTNLALRSQEFDNAYWVLQNVSLTANNTISPNGSLDADLVNVSAISGEHNLYNPTSIVITPNVDYTFSYFVKKGTGRYAAAAIYYAGAAFGPYATYDLNTNTLVASGEGNGTFTSSKLETFSNGWVRISVTGKGNFSNAILATDFRNAENLVPGTSFTGTNETYSIWGAQFESGSYPTSYIPTVASSVTRNADVISKTGISSLIGQTEGTLFLDAILGNENAEMYLILQNILGNVIEDSIYIQRDTNQLKFVGWFGFGLNWNISGGSFTTGQRVKIAAAYKANDIVLYVNGTQIGTDSVATIPPTTSLGLGYFPFTPSSEAERAKNIKASALWKTRLTNAELISLTTI
jgi:hypothetical protein